MFKMKKGLAVSLASLCAFASFATAASATEITATVDGFSVSVTAQTAKKGTNALKCYYVDENGTISSTPLYLGQSEGKPIPAEMIVGEGENAEIITEYIHTFAPFTLDAEAPTGTYRVIVGENVSCDILFVNKRDKIGIYQNIASADQDQIGTVLKDGVETGVLSVDTKTYFDYDEEIKVWMDEALAKLPLPTVSENATDEEIKAFETVLSEEITRLCQAAELFSSEEETFSEAVENADALDLDLKFYQDKNLKLAPEAVHARMENTFPDSFSKEDVKNAFSGAVLLAILDTADYGSVTKALDYYNGTVITLTEQGKKLSKSQKEDVSTALKKKASSIDSLSDLEKAYEDEVEDILKEDDEEDTPSSRPTGGGGGVGGGGNTRPGATTGTLSPNTVPTEPAKPENAPITFTDMGEALWASDAVSYLAEKGVVNGKAQGIYAPNDLVTREEFVKLLTEAIRVTDETATCDFADVSEDRWSYSYIASGVNAGLIYGVSDELFVPGATITRQDMAVMVYRGAALLKLDLTKTKAFQDDASIAPYAKDAVSVLAGAGIVSGMGENVFAPVGYVTRAQAAQIIYNLIMANGGIK